MRSTERSAFGTGVVDVLPFIVMVVPFATLFGVVAIEAGLSLAQTLSFSILVIAGASQFAALQLMLDNAAIGFILAAALAVNLRMAMYSAALAPHLGGAPLLQRAFIGYLNFDHSYVLAVAKYEDQPDMPLPSRVAYFCRGLAHDCAAVVPVHLYRRRDRHLDTRPVGRCPLSCPLAFLSTVAPMLKSPAHIAAACVSVVLALALAGLPSGSGLLIAALCAMVTGVIGGNTAGAQAHELLAI